MKSTGYINETVYTSKEALENCEFPNLNRQIGVSGTRLTKYQGGNWGVEMDYEIPTLNTSTYGGWKEVGSINENALKFNQTAIEHIDVMMAELKAHRERLCEHSRKLKDGGIDLDKQCRELIVQRCLEQTA